MIKIVKYANEKNSPEVYMSELPTTKVIGFHAS